MNISVIGLGYVGLPVACAFAKSGVTVLGVDKNPSLIESLTNKQYSYTEPMLNQTLDDVLGNTLFVSDSIADCNTYIVTVQTPVNEDHTSDNSFVERALTELAPHIKNGDLVILESTVPIGSNKGFYNLFRSLIPANIEFL